MAKPPEDPEEDDSLSEALTDAPLPSVTEIEVIGKQAYYKHNAKGLLRDHPQLAGLIACLLTIPGMTFQVIAKMAKVSPSSVAAIAALELPAGHKFRESRAKAIGAILMAAEAGMMAKAIAGKLNALEYKLLVDSYQLFSGGATVVVETRTESPTRAELRRLLDVAHEVTALPPSNQPVAIEAGMVQFAEEITSISPLELLPPATADLDPLNSSSTPG